VQRPIQPIRQLSGRQSRRLRHETFTEPPALLVGQLTVRRVQVIDEDPCFSTVDVTCLQGREHQRQTLDQGDGEREFAVGGRGGRSEPGCDLVGGPLELFFGPLDGHGPVARQVGDGDGVGDLHHVGEQACLLVGQLPGPGTSDFDQPCVRDLRPRQRVQEGGQLRAGRQRHRPVHEFRHSDHASNLRSTPDILGAFRPARRVSLESPAAADGRPCSCEASKLMKLWSTGPIVATDGVVVSSGRRAAG
jgi:hypothetical protein